MTDLGGIKKKQPPLLLEKKLSLLEKLLIDLRLSTGFSEISGVLYKSILKSITKNPKNSKILNKKSPYGKGNSVKTII
ncbi:MAG: hypothetical protein CXT78_00625 [Thaumarchaeota archaeon]|nr:MAG: hypothetical protein CXT78_00625 [Nitrososphaerota archaeon]